GELTMAKSSKSKASVWYGYLKAGDRSSPVLRDIRLDTANPVTIYMYNLVRGEIIEYAREIVEKKLRELKPAETKYIAELDAGYKKARRSFKGRGASIRNIPERSGPAHKKEKEPAEDDDISAVIKDNADMWVDTEEA
ncbi:MAG: hypothetical protein WBO57_07380, partial [Gammaproteobacteria bacterium]